MDKTNLLEALHQFHFLRPGFLFAILPVLYIVYRLWYHASYRSNWQQVCDPHLLQHLLVSQATSKNRIPIIGIALCWLSLIIALAGPTWHLSTHILYRNMLPQILAVDLSDAMTATDLRPSRIKRVRYKLLDIVEKQKEGRTGMVAFTQEAYTVSPLTEDAATLAAMIPELDPKIMPIAGSNLSRAMKYSAKLLQQSNERTGNLLLVTASTPVVQDYQTAAELHKLGIRVSVYAIGTTQGAPQINDQGYKKDKYGNIILSRLSAAKLQNLAQKGGGAYISFSNDDQDIKLIAALFGQQKGVKRQSAQKIQRWQDNGRMWIILILPLAALLFRRGWLETIMA